MDQQVSKKLLHQIHERKQHLNQNKMTAVEWLYNKMYEHKGIITIEEFEQAKKMEKQEKLKIQIAENESVLEMLSLHGNHSSIMRVFSRLESLKEQLKEINL